MTNQIRLHHKRLRVRNPYTRWCFPPHICRWARQKRKIVGVVRGAYLKFGPKFQYIKRKVEENFLVGHDEWAYLHSTYRCGHWRRFVLIIGSDVRFEIWCSDGHRLGQAYYKIHCDLRLWSLPISFTPNSPLVFVSLRNVILAPSCTL